MKMQDKIFELIKEEEIRQRDTLMMIPSENYSSKAVREAVGSVLAHKYAEGYPGKRYYQGNKIIDDIERLAIERAKKLFGVPHANVQPYSGSPANAAVFMALAKPARLAKDGKSRRGDTVMGMSLAAGGHLTHGHPNITFSGKYFRSVQFGTDSKGFIDYREVRKIAEKEKPKIMIIGTTAYPLAFDWSRFSDIAESVGAWLITDIAHVAGLIVADVYPNPTKYAHVLTTTTHKTLRGPRGAMIMVTEKGIAKEPELSAKIDRAVFPGLQGGPHENTIAGIAIALKEASGQSFRNYGKQVVKNAKVLADELKKGGLTLVGEDTESHIVLVDLRFQELSGNVVAEALEKGGIVVNRNSVPNDKMPPFYPSGIRLGTPAISTRGMKEKDMKTISEWILKIVHHVKDEKLPKNKNERSKFMREYKERLKDDKFLKDIRIEVNKLCKHYPIN